MLRGRTGFEPQRPTTGRLCGDDRGLVHSSLVEMERGFSRQRCAGRTSLAGGSAAASVVGVSYGKFQRRPEAALGDGSDGCQSCAFAFLDSACGAWYFIMASVSESDSRSVSMSVSDLTLSGGVGLIIGACPFETERKFRLFLRRRAGAFSMYSICASASLCCQMLARELSELWVDDVRSETVILLLTRARLERIFDGVRIER